MYFVLVRHGNTFNPGDKVVWVGARTDLPLVSSGEEQAEFAGRALKDRKIAPHKILCSPLKRTTRTAEIIAGHLGFPAHLIQREDRLREVDYGLWEGLSSDEVRQRHGGDEMEAWDKRSEWPRSAGWSPAPDAILARVTSLIAELTADLPDDAVVILVSSNGILRYFLDLAGKLDEYGPTGKAKLGTGRIGVLRRQDGIFSVLTWNAPPDQLPPIASE